MKTYWGKDIQIHVFTSALVGGEWSASRPGRFTWDSSDGTMTEEGWTVWGSEFESRSGTQPASYPMGTGVSFPRGII
jgi:hypothetical protein